MYLIIMYLRNMKLKEFLDKNKIINQSELARLMFTGNKSAQPTLQHKLKGTITAAGRSPQQLTSDDIQKAIEVLKKVAEDIADIDK